MLRARLISSSLIVACLAPVATVFARPWRCISAFPKALHRSYQDLSQEISALSRKLDSPDEEERREAALKLGWLSSPEVISPLTKALNDSSERVRAAAAAGLAASGNLSVIPVLTARLAEEKKSPFMRKTIAYALSRFHDQPATIALIALLKDKDVEVRCAATVALAVRPDPATIAPLVAALKDKSEFVRAHAARGLGINRRAAAGSVEELSRLLTSDPDNEVRRQSAIALGLIGEPSALAALKRAEQSSDPYLSRAARSSIKLIEEERR